MFTMTCDVDCAETAAQEEVRHIVLRDVRVAARSHQRNMGESCILEPDHLQFESQDIVFQEEGMKEEIKNDLNVNCSIAKNII